MIICKKCGGQNEEGADFCGSCGAFLEWSGKKTGERRVLDLDSAGAAEPQQAGSPSIAEQPSVEDASAAGGVSEQRVTVEAPPEEPPPDLAVIIEREEVLEVSKTSEVTHPAPATQKKAAAKAEAVAESPVPTTPAEKPIAGAVPKDTASEARAQSPAKEKQPRKPASEEKPAKAASEKVSIQETTTVRRAEALVAPPVRPTRPIKRRPADKPARKPEPSKNRPAPVASPAAPTRQIRPGDLICGQCGEGNDPVRKFCRRCGTSLQEATVVPVPPVPWWKRLFTRRRKALQAGQRPGRGGVGDTAERAGAVGETTKRVAGLVTKLILAGAVVVGGIIGIPKLVDLVKGLNTSTERIYPKTVSATSQARRHGADLLADKKTDTYWAEAVRGNGENQTVTFAFDQPFHLVALGFYIQAQGTDQPRPERILLSFYDSSGKLIEAKAHRLKDTHEFQSLKVNAREVVRVALRILSVRPPVNGRGSVTSISEVEFSTPS